MKQSSRFRATNPSSVPLGGELKKKGRAGREGIKPKPIHLRKISPILEILLGDAAVKPGILFLQLLVIDAIPGAGGGEPGDVLSKAESTIAPKCHHLSSCPALAPSWAPKTPAIARKND